MIDMHTALGEEQLSSFEFIKSAPEVFERTIDFMVTISLALFGIVGYSFTIISPNIHGLPKKLAYAILSVFVIAGATTLISGYFSREWLIMRLSVGKFDYENTSTYVVQAASLLIASAAACAFWVLALSTREPAAR
jgi:hypothetical protein